MSNKATKYALGMIFDKLSSFSIHLSFLDVTHVHVIKAVYPNVLVNLNLQNKTKKEHLIPPNILQMEYQESDIPAVCERISFFSHLLV